MQSIDKQGLELPGDDQDALKKRQDKIQEEHKDLTDWMKELYGKKVCFYMIRGFICFTFYL